MALELTTDELIERIAVAMQEMPGEELAELYNREFGCFMTYQGNDFFEQGEPVDGTDN